MKISYKKLWHLLIDRGLNKQDLRRMTGISTASIAKLGKGENITTDILEKSVKLLNVMSRRLWNSWTNKGNGVAPNKVLLHFYDIIYYTLRDV